MPYDWPANFVRAIDGDTIEVVLDRGFHDHSFKRLRLAGIDTPELRDKDTAVRAKAIEAKDFVTATLDSYREGFRLIVHTHKTRKGNERRTFGRYVADVELPPDPDAPPQQPSDLGKLLVWKGLAVPSKG